MCKSWQAPPRANDCMVASVFRQLSAVVRKLQRDFHMIDSLLNTLLFCAHRRTTFPMTTTMSRQPHASSTLPLGKRTYVICLDCGKEFSYNWKEMRIVAAEPIADWGIRRVSSSWFASAHTLLGNRRVAANFSLLRRNACGSVNSLLIGLWSAVSNRSPRSRTTSRIQRFLDTRTFGDL
jgi:hypothetical protein